jgi:N-acetylglucosamine-6-phosphate deacetylase
MHIHSHSAVIENQVKENICIKANDGIITVITSNCSETPESRYEGTLIPGFVDIHSHGGGGYYFSNPDLENIVHARNSHMSHGTTTQIASLLTEPIGILEEQILRLVPLVNAGLFEGIHLEGPYLSEARCGAHEPLFLRTPVIDELSALLDAGEGTISMVTLAPELEGGIAAIEYLNSRGVTVALGHSQADAATTGAAIAAGAQLITHFTNGMPKPSDGKGTITSAALVHPTLPLEIILDGVHVGPEILGKVRSSSHRRTILITDAMSAAGAPDGDYTIGSLGVVVKDRVARLTSNNYLAGSTLTMDVAFLNLLKSGASLIDCVDAASTLPAKTLGLNSVGSITVGKRAHLLEYLPSAGITVIAS